MPRKKKVLSEDELIEKKGFSNEKPIEEELDYEDQEIGSMFDGMPSGVRCISLFRITGGERGGRPKFISQIAPECFEEPFIQEQFGGGLYFARWKKKDGAILRSKPMEIDGEPKDQKPPRLDKEDEPETAYIANQQPSHYPSAGPEHGGLSAIELFKMMNDERREARAEAREEMRTILELMKPAQQSPDMTKQVFDIVEKVVSMTGQVGGDGGNPWITTLAMFKEPLTKIVDTIQSAVNRPSIPNPPAHPAVRQAQPAAPVQVASQPQEEDVIQLLIRQYLPVLVGAASKNSDTETYANLILDQVPESQYASFRNWLTQPDCLDRLAQIAPAIQYQQDWWISLRQTLAEALTDALQPDSTPEQSQQD